MILYDAIMYKYPNAVSRKDFELRNDGNGYYEWATADMVKQALAYQDCSIEDLAEGVNKKLITADQYKEITGKAL